MVSYAPDELRYRYNTPEAGRAVFSEVYYPAGWKARLEDGSELEISLSSEVLRAIDLPAGEHELTMSFEPASYRKGEAVSRASSILLILLVLGCAAASITRITLKQ